MVKTVRLDLGPDFEGQWVDLLDPKFMSSRKFDELLAVLKKEDKTDEETEAFVRGRIAGWHVLDADSGELIGDPAATADLGGLPLGVMRLMGDRISELFAATGPNASRRS